MTDVKLTVVDIDEVPGEVAVPTTPAPEVKVEVKRDPIVANSLVPKPKKPPAKMFRGTPPVIKKGQYYAIRSQAGRQDVQYVKDITIDITVREKPIIILYMESLYFPGRDEVIKHSDVYLYVTGYAEPETP